MKYIFAIITVFVIIMVFIPGTLFLTNWYPFGYPVKQGKYYHVETIVHKGEPIEKRYITLVRVDSTYRGYVIKATDSNGWRYTDGNTMYGFMGKYTTFGPDIFYEITKEQFESGK